MIGYVLGSLVFGIAYSIVLVFYYRAISDRKALKATGYDLLIGGLTVAPFQFWALSGMSGWVLAAEVIGSAVGTYVALTTFSKGST